MSARGIRLDVMLAGIAEQVVRKIEPACNNVPLWDGGLGQVITTAIAEDSSIPKQLITPVDLARRAGILKKGRRTRVLQAEIVD